MPLSDHPLMLRHPNDGRGVDDVAVSVVAAGGEPGLAARSVVVSVAGSPQDPGLSGPLLGQWSAASLLLLASMRFVVSIWLVRRILMWFFMGLACAAALATYQGALSLIGLLASLLQTRAAFCPDDRQLRRWMLLGTLCWLGNNLLVGSPVAALMEGLFLVSNLVGYYRHYGFDYWGRGRHCGRRKRCVPPSERASS